MNEPRRYQYLDAMGIQRWERRSADATVPGSDVTEAEAIEGPVQAAPAVAAEPSGTALAAEIASPSAPVAELDWEALATRVATCTDCELHRSRTHTVFGVGDRRAQWMIIGEAPGAEEDRQGEPFVGRAGQLLNSMLRAIGLKREQAYIANILKCRPPNNRDPLPEEVACCEPYLARQVALLQPRIILAVGRVAAQNLLKTDTSLARLRGRLHQYGEMQTPVVVTYHPAYLLRSPSEKRKAWQDLKLAVATLAEAEASG